MTMGGVPLPSDWTATLVTVAMLKEHAETDLSDAALQRIIDAAEAEVIKRFGPHYDSELPIVETVYSADALLFPSRPVLTISDVTEYSGNSDTTGTVLTSADYRIVQGGRAVLRLNTSYWAWGAAITYQPVTDNAQRVQVILDLCKLALQYSGFSNVSDGDHRETALDYPKEREKILRSLTPRGGLLLA